MERLTLQIRHREVEDTGRASPLGEVRVERGDARALLLTPAELEPAQRYPLITVFHGAGRQDEMLARAFRDEADRRQAFFLIPRSVAPTWDLIAGTSPNDFDFLEYAWDLIYRRYPIDPGRQCLMGYSDGASYALSLGLSNPATFDAVLGWAAGFVAVAPRTLDLPDPKPRIYLEYGTHDELFPFEQIAVPMRETLAKAGYDLTFSVDEGGHHWPSGSFHREALDWYFVPGAESS